MPPTAAHIFVYGTLRRACGNPFARLLSERAHFVGEARVQGRLYDLGSYPGGQPAGDPGATIRGEVFRLAEPGAVLAALDAYEGREFQRAVVRAGLDGGRTIDCWIYWYAGLTAGQPLASGDWLAR
jgi:gamma-glutamylcyclotransferase (GGCT)/AIG2-like uncharacterized protein YtfP